MLAKFLLVEVSQELGKLEIILTSFKENQWCGQSHRTATMSSRT